MIRRTSAALVANLGLGLLLGCADVSGEVPGSGVDAEVIGGESDDAVGGATAAVVSGDVDAAGLRENAVARFNGCTATLISPNRMILAEHCLDDSGPPPTCATHVPGTPDWENRGAWYPFACSPGQTGPSVVFGASKSKVSVSATAAGIFERFTIVDEDANTINSGDYVYLRSAGGYYLSENGNFIETRFTTNRITSTRFRIFRASGVTGQIPSGVGVRLQVSGSWVRVAEGDVFLDDEEAYGTVFMIARYAGDQGPILHNGYITLMDGTFRFLTAEDGGGPVDEFETFATRYNITTMDDIALIELNEPVPSHVATPMDVIHRVPGVTLQARSQVNGSFCLGTDTCLTGDFNDDGYDDLLSATSGGVISVGLSTGTSVDSSVWATGIQCTGVYDCVVGDFDGDDRDDIARFQTTGGARVALSLPTDEFGYPGIWGFSMPCATAGKTCVAGDVNGDGLDDIVIFHRSSDPLRTGDVDVAVSNGSGFFQPVKYHDSFCAGAQTCNVGDFTHDGDDDIVAFMNDSSGYVYVAPSRVSNFTRSFGTSDVWLTGFCTAGMTCGVGDFDGDGFSDVAAFTRNVGATSLQKRVRVAISDGEYFGPANTWSADACTGNQVCIPSDFSGDGRSDVVVFYRNGTSNRAGDVDVARSSSVDPLHTFFLTEEVRAGGWGGLTFDGTFPVAPVRRRYGTFEFESYGLNGMTLQNIGQGACNFGDSGSPVRWFDPNKQEWVIIGVAVSGHLSITGDCYGVTSFGAGGQSGTTTLLGTGDWYRGAMAAP